MPEDRYSVGRPAALPWERFAVVWPTMLRCLDLSSCSPAL